MSCNDGVNSETQQKIDELSVQMPDLMRGYYVSGVSMAVVNNFELEWTQAFGVTDIISNAPVTDRTLFQASSVSQSLTAMGVLKLVQNEKLDLNTAINEYLESWSVPVSSTGILPRLSLKSLLSRSLGTSGKKVEGYVSTEPVPSAAGFLDAAYRSNPEQKIPLINNGSLFEDYTMVQLVVSDISKNPFHSFMRETIFSPLRMDYSTFEQPLPESLLQFAALGHYENGSLLNEGMNVFPQSAAAGLWTTPHDLSRFIIEIQKSIQGTSEQVLNQKMVQTMVTPVSSGKFALGNVISQKNGGSYFGHSGINEGYTCEYIASLEGGYGVVVMTNGGLGARIGRDIIQKIFNLYGW